MGGLEKRESKMSPRVRLQQLARRICRLLQRVSAKGVFACEGGRLRRFRLGHVRCGILGLTVPRRTPATPASCIHTPDQVGLCDQ